MQTVKKIVVIGPESTGKSTLSAALSAKLHTIWVPEYARAYLEELPRPYTAEDLTEIALGQLEDEDKLEKYARKYLVCDTDLNVIRVWSEHRYGHCDRRILEHIATRKYDLYLLTDIDIPWEEDPLREHPDSEMRSYFYHVYRDLVQQSGTPWVNIAGNQEERLTAALAAVLTYCN